MIKLDEFISLSERNTVSGRFSIDWSKTFEGIKIPHRKQGCLDCNIVKSCSDSVIKPKKNCINCETERTCKMCSDRISQKKTYSTDINMLKRKPAIEYYQMLPYYEGKYEYRQNKFDFEFAKEVLMSFEKPMIENRRFERRDDMIACKLYIKNEDVSENKEISIYGFKHNTDKIDSYILIGCESDELCEIDNLFNSRLNKIIYKEKEMRYFKITRWSFMTLVKWNNFFKTRSICL